MTGDNDNVFARWSRRKQAVEAAERAPSVDPETGPEPETDVAPDEELPDPDTLEEGDDFSVFMKANVPDALRRRALRRLWRLNPAFANLDGLVDYGEDFTDAAMVPDVLATAYKVGRGLLQDPTDAEDVPAEQDAPAEDEEQIVAENAVADPPDSLTSAAPHVPAEVSETQGTQVDVELAEDSPVFRPKRMVFRTG